MYLIDTNIFLEILLNQKNAEECERFLKRINNSQDAFYISSFTLHSIEVIMARNKQEDALLNFLLFIEKSKIIKIDTTVSDEREAVENIERFSLDFDDSVQLTISQKYNLGIVSYDKHFDKTPVKRVEPLHLLN